MTRVYVRDSLIDMTADKQTQSEGSLHTDQIGKVFVCVGKNVRQCLVCEQLFTRRAASEHAKAACHWVLGRKAGLYTVSQKKESTC